MSRFFERSGMLVATQGDKEQTEAEFRALLAAAGFRLTRILPTESPVSVIGEYVHAVKERSLGCNALETGS